jgi:3-dehydroquinate synthase
MSVEPLIITTPAGSYPILVGPGLLGDLPAQLDALDLRGKLWLIADGAVYPHHGEMVVGALRGVGYYVEHKIIPSGEASKDLAVVSSCYDWMIGGGVERRDAMLALGGGVIGDLAGFVAATVLRGIAFVQLPTTLLAMVDSALGGKTGVNHPLGKNLIGAFHQPRLVLSDTNTLATLPPRELNAGWAEVIKHGVIRDAELFEMLEQESGVRSQKSEVSASSGERSSVEPRKGASTLLAPDSWLLNSIIKRAVKVKVDVVNADERETGERMLLNYGHTLGHAVEAAAGYGTLLHGEAVAIGMDLEARIAQQLGMVDAAMVARQRALLRAYSLPTEVPASMAADAILELTLRDKKVHAGKVRWALATGIGGATVRDDVPAQLVRAVVEAAIAARQAKE